MTKGPINTVAVALDQSAAENKKPDFYSLKHNSLNYSVEVCSECALLFCNVCLRPSCAPEQLRWNQIGRGTGRGGAFCAPAGAFLSTVLCQLTCCRFLASSFDSVHLPYVVIPPPPHRRPLSVIVALCFQPSFALALGAQHVLHSLRSVLY